MEISGLYRFSLGKAAGNWPARAVDSEKRSFAYAIGSVISAFYTGDSVISAKK
jgi:hypothetical protein